MDGERDPSQGAKNRATARRTASQKRRENGWKVGPLSPVSTRFFRLLFPSSRLSPLSERLEQARVNRAALCHGDLAGFLAHLSRMATFLCSDLGSFHSNPLSESLLITAREAEPRGDWEGDGTREPALEPVGSITSRCSGNEPALLPCGETKTGRERAAEIEPIERATLCNHAIIFPTIQDASDVPQ